MATALSAQLAQIAANSTNQLNLKAQKKAHSQSLIFEKDVASSQDFDTLYQICLEGFQEICHLDPRFVGFSRNIFGEQSKREERTQMTEAQNKELDNVLESFLALVGAKILLKPAIKSVEWLVRRFRVHEYNTIAIVQTFLPYHTMPIFATLLSILPKSLPPVLKFLQPYVESFANPPRKAIVYAATSNGSFLSSWNNYVLKSNRDGYGFHAMVSYWATVASEALAGQLDQAASGRGEVQKQKEEDVLRRILPVLDESLAMRNAPELRVGSCIILTVLASKMKLADELLSAMMEALVTGSTKDTAQGELICLAVLSQQRESLKIPKKVFKALLTRENLAQDVIKLGQSYRIGKLALGVILGILEDSKKAPKPNHLRFITAVAGNGILPTFQSALAIKAVLKTVMDPRVDMDEFDTQGQLADLAVRLIDSKDTAEVVESVVKKQGFTIHDLETRLQTIFVPIEDRPLGRSAIEAEKQSTVKGQDSFDSLKAKIPTRTAYETSFLSHSESFIFGSLARCFSLASHSSDHLSEFANFPVLRKSLASSEPLFISFFLRFWTGPYHPKARAAALSCVSKYLKSSDLSSDPQIVIPYVLCALHDQFSNVRTAATDLVLTLSFFYNNKPQTSDESHKLPVLGNADIYGSGDRSQRVSWLSVQDASALIEDVLLPSAEECRLDHHYIVGLIEGALGGSRNGKAPQSTHQELKSQTKAAILSSLCSHAINTPVHAVQLRLLCILNGITKTGGVLRSKSLHPLMIAHVKMSEYDFDKQCKEEQVDPTAFRDELMKIVPPSDREGNKILQEIISPGSPTSGALKKAAIRRMHSMWNDMKVDTQYLCSATLFKLLFDSSTGLKTEAMETLQNVPLSTRVLLHFLEQLPEIATDSDLNLPSSKRRKTNQGLVSSQERNGAVTDQSAALKATAIVLELVESSKEGLDLPLLPKLFQVLAAIQESRGRFGSDLNYPLTLVLECLYTISEKVKANPEIQLERHSVRADLVIESFRSTSSPQVQYAALLLISSLASVAPETIVHSIMPVFTFMGATVLRQTDDYSAHIIDQLVESVVPPLIETLRKQKGGPIPGASDLLLSFVAAFDHIPPQRRPGLFSALIEKLGADDFLFVLFTMLMDRYGDDKATVNFMLDLSARYSGMIQLRTLEKCLDVVIDSLKPKPTISTHLLSLKEGRTRASTAFNLMTLPLQILRTSKIRSRVAKILGRENEHSEELRLLYARIVERILSFADEVQSNKKLSLACEELLDALVTLLSLQESTKAVDMLLDRGNESIKRRMLKSLEQRIAGTKRGDIAARKACLDFLRKLDSVLQRSTDADLKQTATMCINHVAEKFGKSDMAQLRSSIDVVSGSSCLGSDDPQLIVIGLICLTTMVESLQDAIVPGLPQVLSTTFKHLGTTVRAEQPNDNLHNAIYSLFTSIMLYIPWILTGPSLDSFLSLSHESANAGLEQECNSARAGALDLLAKQTNAEELFSALTRTWNNAMADGPEAVNEHLTIARVAIERHPKTVIIKQAKQLTSFFLEVLDLRRIQLATRTEDSYDEAEIAQVESAASETMIKMIYKLNDTHFRPLFAQMSEWSTSIVGKDKKREKLLRQTAWYAFLRAFFDTLKSIVTNYAGLIVDNTAELLNALSGLDPDTKALWDRIISTLTVAFEHQQDEYWQSPARFVIISTPLLAQFAHAADSPVESALIPCVTAFASAASTPEHHKVINSAILAHLRSEHVRVRLAAVRCEISITESLGEEWLSLLPEMLPSISEAMEDDDEAVEAEVRRWVRGIEEILGESLDDMLQ